MKKTSLKSKVAWVTILAIFFTSIGFVVAYKMFIAPKKEPQTWVVPNLKDTSNKFITKETLINEISQKQELITMDTDLNQKITIDTSWGNMDLFKKVQSIKFFGKGIYAVDLSKLEASNISVEKKSITLSIPKPYVKALEIDETKTVYETPEKGLLRFGEIKLAPQEFEAMMNGAKEKMKQTLTSNELYDAALKNTETSISNVVKSILSEDTKNNYEVVIKFKD